MRQILAALAISLLLTACAAPQTRQLLANPSSHPVHVELAEVSFFPQTEHQCGPAALATVLAHAGVTVTPEQLTPQVYLPGREGSLAVEMIVATRRHDRVAYRIAPTLAAALDHVAAGRPVLILQNRGLAMAPLWHYAVLVGFDLHRREVVLRSGELRREILPIDTFERTWARSDYWGVVVMKPDALPDFVPTPEALQQALAMERIQHLVSAHALYTALLQREPGLATARFGLANTAYALGNGLAAEQHWRALIRDGQAGPPVFHNLGQFLLEQGRTQEAQSTISEARRRWPEDGRLKALEQVTR